MNLRRTLAIIALSLGVVGGYGSAVWHATHGGCGRACHGWHHESP